MTTNALAKTQPAGRPRAMTAAMMAQPYPSTLELFSEVPGWAIAHAAQDHRNAPMIRKGEIAVIENHGTCGWLPTEGGLFLIEYVSKPLAQYERVRRTHSIVQTIKSKNGDWYAASIRRGMIGQEFYAADGPYQDFNDLADKLIGRVVGLYAPSIKGERQ
jgi:hypothetical protein